MSFFDKVVEMQQLTQKLQIFGMAQECIALLTRHQQGIRMYTTLSYT